MATTEVVRENIKEEEEEGTLECVNNKEGLIPEG